MKKWTKVASMVASLAVASAIGVGVCKNKTVLADEGEVYPDSSVTIDEKNFPDENFRNYIVNTVDTDGNNILSQEEIDDVLSIDVTLLNLEKLKGIEFFTSLRELYCSQNYLSEIDISRNVNLEVLFCKDNELTSLDLSKNTALINVDCDNNRLYSLDVSKNTNLRELYCGFSELTDLDVRANLELQQLGCSGNKLTTLDVSHNSNLSKLYCYENQLSNLDVSKNILLSDFYCYKNQLTSIDVSKNVNLFDFRCNDNQLKELNVSNATKLAFFYCGSNILTELDLSNNTSLNELSCSDNQLTSLIVCTPGLRKIYCSDNHLTTLDISTLTSLNVLDCSSNQLTSLDVSSMYGNEHTGTYLYCQNNLLQNLDVSSLTHLKVLDCSDNRIEEIILKNNTSLYSLGCSNNIIKQLDISNNNLEYLECHENEITKLNLETCTNLLNHCSEYGVELIDEGKHYICGANLGWDDERIYLYIDSFVSTNPEIFEPIPKPTNTPTPTPNPQVTSTPIPTATPAPTDKPTPTPTQVPIVPTPTLAPIATMPNVVGMSLGIAQEYVMNNLSPACDQVKIKIQWEENDAPEKGNLVCEQDPRAGFQFFGHTEYIYVTLVVYKEVPIKEPPTIADFVERLYTVALNRASEPAGKKYWVDEISNGNKTGADCGLFFLTSEEFNNRGLSIENFVETLYKTFFGRDSEPNGKAYWVGELKSGRKSRADVIWGFIDSKEWCNICADYGVKSGAPTAKAEHASRNAIGFVTRLYVCCLGRDPEEAGLKYWSLALTNLEQTGCSAAKLFFTSDEFLSHKITDDAYLVALYETFMNRDPQQDELAYWTGEIKKGTQTRYSIMQFFGQSPEFTEICKKYGIDRGTI